MTTGYKRCPDCGEWTNDFSPKYSGKNRLSTYCRPCHNARQNRRRNGHDADTWKVEEAKAMQQAALTMEFFHRPLNALRA